MMYGVILAGGVGTRLWPRSRQNSPKQFADITGSGKTMIQATSDRLAGLIDPDHRYVVTGRQYADLAARQLAGIPDQQIIAEPDGRNTAPAIGLACVHVSLRDPDAVVAILPADHVIPDVTQFQQALAAAERAASDGYIVTLGIEPTFPHTGYGYIKAAQPLNRVPSSLGPVFEVDRFLEKPDRTTAERFLAEGGYYWNGGIFVSRVDTMLDEIQRQLPPVYDSLARIRRALKSGGTGRIDEVTSESWQEMPSISIDQGVMENARSVAMVPLHAGWSDVGSWDALQDVLQSDDTGTCIVQGEVINLDSQNNIVYSDKRVVALLGVEDLVVVDTEDSLLVGRKSQMQRVKELVEQLRDQERFDLL